MAVIGIIGAMDEEVAKLIDLMKDVQKTEIACMSFYEGILEGKDVVIVRSGIGKVNMAVCTQLLIDRYHVSTLINTGVAGALNAQLNIGDIVVSRDALQHDMDATGFGYEPGVIPRMECSIFEADKNLIDVAKAACENVNPDIQCFIGRVVTGDQFISDQSKKKQLLSVFSGFCTEMEGGSMAQVAYLNHVPFVILRAISDKADQSAEMNYADFEHQAIEHTVHLLKEMITKL